MSPDEETQTAGESSESAPAEAAAPEPTPAPGPEAAPAEAAAPERAAAPAPEAAAPEPAAAPAPAAASAAPSGAAASPPAPPRRSEPSRGDRDRDRGGDREERGGGGGGRRYFGRRKVCTFCVDKATSVDYKDPAKLRRFVSDRGRIEGRRRTGTCAKHQRWLATALKRARHLALLPYAPEHIRLTGAFASRR